MTEATPRRPAVVTGASSGIGAATAAAICAAGHPVVLGARRLDRCEELAAGLRAAGGDATAIRLDITEAESVAEFAKETAAAYGHIEILVSNAGDVLPTSVLGTDPDVFTDQLEVNLMGAQRLVHTMVPDMVERRRGDVVFVTSDVVRSPRPSMSSYVTSKWGLEGLARAMQMELEGTGVRASIVRPGPTVTGMGETWDPAMLEPLMKLWTDWGFMRHEGYLTPEAIAGAVMAVIGAPPGTHLTLVEVEPEAPVVAD
jgi:NADP-dependent 3-hydroxy acid dehydrogenase YdfG